MIDLYLRTDDEATMNKFLASAGVTREIQDMLGETITVPIEGVAIAYVGQDPVRVIPEEIAKPDDAQADMLDAEPFNVDGEPVADKPVAAKVQTAADAKLAAMKPAKDAPPLPPMEVLPGYHASVRIYLDNPEAEAAIAKALLPIAVTPPDVPLNVFA